MSSGYPMASSAVLKRFIKRSTQKRLRNLQRAIHDLWTDVSCEWRHGGDLRLHCQEKTGLLLNVGCGDLIQPGWVNIDFKPKAGAFYFNASNPLSIADQTIKHIHAEHFLEHLEYDDALRFLSECHRVLADGGTMRIIVPDAEKYMRAYASNDKAFFEKLKDLGGSPVPLATHCAICNQMFRMGGDHCFAWDFPTLEYVCQLAGFSAIRRSHLNDSSEQNCIDGQDWWRPFESLYAVLVR